MFTQSYSAAGHYSLGGQDGKINRISDRDRTRDLCSNVSYGTSYEPSSSMSLGACHRCATDCKNLRPVFRGWY